MNTQLLEQVRDAILEEPSRFSMKEWVNPNHPGSKCGTSACIAGFALVLNTTKGDTAIATWKEGIFRWAYDPGYVLFEDARKLLDLTSAQAERLFADRNWPQPWRDVYRNATTDQQAAGAAAGRINLFLETKGEQ